MKVGNISKSVKNLIQTIALTIFSWIALSGQAFHPYRGSQHLIDDIQDGSFTSVR